MKRTLAVKRTLAPRSFALAFILAAFVGGCAPRVPPRATAADAERSNIALADLEHGRSLVISKCGSRCHKTPMPSQHTALEWPKALDEMSPRANVAGDDRRAIERYLVVMARRR
jgi:hypothetical protein